MHLHVTPRALDFSPQALKDSVYIVAGCLTGERRPGGDGGDGSHCTRKRQIEPPPYHASTLASVPAPALSHRGRPETIRPHAVRHSIHRTAKLAQMQRSPSS